MSGSQRQPARKIVLSGVVQGVGFRPFIYRHALAHGLVGWVRNASGRVEVHAQGAERDLDSFIDSLVGSAPPLSEPVVESVSDVGPIDTEAFMIRDSRADREADIRLPADLFTCDDCLAEIDDPGDRRYHYPFINCTQCGPRYTLIGSLPYDRPNTSMADFPLCQACAEEYTDPRNRRYHAEPVACEECGPELTFVAPGEAAVRGNEAALGTALSALARGKVLAVKGIGGYHLVCDARNDQAVAALRAAKPRPHKPLAVMFPAPVGDRMQFVREYLEPGPAEAELLTSPARPIVLVPKRPGGSRPDHYLSPAIAPGLNEVGVMLPYSPLHHILLTGCGWPLVATSANLSGEPVLTENADVERRLAHVADAWLHHDRPIVRPADDPVFRVIGGQPAPIRQGRGLSPVEIDLPFEIPEPVLAVGPQMKNTLALAWDKRVVISPHIGEMDRLRSLETFERCIADMQALYQVEARLIVCDAHPGYTSTRWARGQGRLPVRPAYHHHAHASAAYLDALRTDDRQGDMLVFTWDGVGLGPDGTLWGGEALLGSPGRWRRAASFRPFRLPGGERAGREPWRSAAGLCWESGLECPLPEASDPLLHRFWLQGANSPQTSAVGRLFDGAAALCGVCSTASFEGQGPMYLEALAAGYANSGNTDPVRLALSRSGETCLADWAPLLPMLIDGSRTPGVRAACFHASLAHTILSQALEIGAETGVRSVGLTGGVFQNRLLAENAIGLLTEHGFRVTLPSLAPVNDGGISLGQVVEHAFGGSE